MCFMRNRWSWVVVASGFVVLSSVTRSVRADQGVVPRLYIEPIPGLTTVRHPAPEAMTVPKGTVLTVCHGLRSGGSSNPGDGSQTAAVDQDQWYADGSYSPPATRWTVAWTGATEIRSDEDMSWAESAL